MNTVFIVLLITGSPAIGLSSLFAGLGGKAITLRKQRPFLFTSLVILLGFAVAVPSLIVGKYLGELPACLFLLVFSILVGKIAKAFCSGLVKITLRLPEER
ncbi:MAG: hypothetical protein QXU01_02055 [Candidatus Hadarchaeales archaeon]